MTSAVLEAPSASETHRCIACSVEDNHPKDHILYGKTIFDAENLPKWASFHHDCIGNPDDDALPNQVREWRDLLLGDTTSEGDRLRAIVDKAWSGVRGDQLRNYIVQSVPLIGNGPRMITTGMDIVMGEAILNALHPNSATKTIGTVTITAPVNIRAMSAIGATDAVAGTEITTGSSYTAAGSGLGAPTWGTGANVGNIASLTTITAALNKTGMPARTIVALEEWDSSGTPLRGFWGAVTSLTTNTGDTVSIAIGALVDTLQ